MKISIIQIGNSQGIRLPKAVIHQCGFKDIVEAEIKDGKLILSSVHEPRLDWRAAFESMAKQGDDSLIDSELIELKTDDDEWIW